RRAIEHAAELRPVDQVAAVKDRNAGEPSEGRVDQIVIVADAADAGIGIKAGEDRVEELAIVQSGRRRFSAFVAEPGEVEIVLRFGSRRRSRGGGEYA